ncbi:PREDICTED: telomere-associated protein RIF1 isoform X2 [Wasmannia auropunctata]|uniref:telomere-associated protein RIF1 isoform X2 n=1 Tax=Wasmannia auropunctata TaxID=64793 RepID=UPI0005EFA9CB|nr:PREDICTED: telomere-associated protein RIF1 isoform X2 [Wasmannia auropunctata]
MAAITSATFPKLLKALRDNGNVKEKREALTYIASQAKKLEASGVIKEDRYKDLCKLVIELFSKNDGIFQIEAIGAFNAIMREFRAHPLNLFESMLQTDMKTRLKIFKLLEVLDDNSISTLTNDAQGLSFFKSCLYNVQPPLMVWLMPATCDNLQTLTKIEQQPQSEQYKLEEDLNNHAIALLRRLYRMASITFDQSVQKFDTLLMDKIVMLAYMGHKRQRGSALKLLQQAITTNSPSHIRKDYPNLWAQYKTNLQSTYYKRMLVLVAACDVDWTTQWNITIQFLGTDLHRGASLINNLLSVEEKAFKSIDPLIRRQAFLSWKLLIDNFALDHQELATARRIKLLCIPLNAKNSKTELIALTKLEVWWHLIVKLYRNIGKFVTPVVTQFLNYCFGPLGDTPLLSSKFDVVASPGKRFFKTKMVAVDALSQLLVAKEDLVAVCSPMLEERLPNAMSFEVFRECSKYIIHSIAEALLILGQLTDKEMKNRFQLGKTLWTSLMIYIRTVKLETKDHLYRDVILVVNELGNHIDKVMVKDMIFNVILPDVNCIIEKTDFHDNALPELVLKLFTSPILDEMLKYILNYDSNAIKCLLERCVSPEFTYSSGVLGFLETIMKQLKSVYDARKNKDNNDLAYIELWSVIAEILTKYIRNTEINEDDNFKVMKSVLSFPFHICLEDLEQIKNHAAVWKTVYKEVELHSDLMNTMKANEILLDTASMMRNCLSTNKNCCTFIVNCLDALLNTLDYESLLAQDEIPSIIQLIVDVVTLSVTNVQNVNSEAALKALSAMLITIYGHSTQRVVSYLHYSKSVIELILSSPTTELFKEVANTWEYVVSIFKGLNKELDHKLLSSYKKSITIAINHANSDIRSLTQNIFEIKDSLDSSAKCILDEIEMPKEKSHSKSNSVTKKKTETGQAKEVRIAGSFLNRKSTITHTKSVFSKPPEKSNKNTFTLPEPDSQDYVYIKTNLQFDVNRLTEHQKETLKKKREDIPALYNDLSQSSSQNSQNLQQWFDMKAKHINESDKASDKRSDPIIQKPVDNDANKENEVTEQVVEFSNAMDKTVDTIHSNEPDENMEKNTVDAVTSSMKNDKKDESNEKQGTAKQTNLSSPVASTSGKSTSKVNEETDAAMTIEHVTRKLDFESRDEFPEDKTHERQSSPSMLDSIKRRRSSMTKSTALLKDDEIAEAQKDPSAANVQRTLRMKITQEKPGTNSKQKSDDDTDVKENVNENKKGFKRKYVSESDSDGSVRMERRKRKLIKNLNDDDGGGETSRSSDFIFSDINMENVSQRVKNEISRLKINMVFDCPAVNRRRVKHSEEERETAVHGLRKYDRIPDNKNKSRSVDGKYVEGSKRSPKEQEKSTKDVRRRRSKQESNKNDINKDTNKDVSIDVKDIDKDVNKDKNVKKSNDTVDKVHELKNAGTDITKVVPTSSPVQDVNKTQDEGLEDNSKSNADVRLTELTEPSELSEDEVEDVVESSQVPNVGLMLDKICSEKQCFIKIDKMANIHAVKTSDAIVNKNYVPESIPMDCDDNDVPAPCEELKEANSDNSDSNTNTKDDENTDTIDKDSVQKTDNSNTKSLVSEGQKTIDNSSSIIKPTSVITFSPRSNNKVFSKPKPFTGRAAHMLGLVTNQARLENDSLPVVLEEEPSVKKLKTKDAENEMSTNKKTLTIKEIDKLGGPSGSRQEKIFSNMRSTDYSASSSTSAFTTLKNEGEKLSFKLNKGASDYSSTESSVDKENERSASPSREKEDLPILEWSSANPPSLTASPSASILKRHRSSLPEPDLDISTTPKRKRVSFADPPVSKEMSYEIATAESPQKIKYSVARSPTPKKDTPNKFRQTKLKLIPFDTEKIITEDNAQDENDMEVAVEVEKTNESLTKISEAYAEIPDDEQMAVVFLESDNILETSSCMKIDQLELAREIEITTSSFVPENQQSLSSKDSNNVSPMGVETQTSETQQDIFDGMDAKTSATVIKTSNDVIRETVIQNNSIDSIKLNVTDDSVIAALPTEDDTPTNMEDTIDVQNVTGLNSTVNTDEIFCQKPIRSSTHATENLAEQDTLSVTDSLFASLASTQDIRNQEAPNNAQLDPEFLDSTEPIYPTLSSCVEPIDSIVEQLTYPLWKHNLSMYFANRNMRTIGDFAQLSEREVNRMPVKGKPKTEFVKKVLEQIESMLQTKRADKKSNEVEQLPAETMDEEPAVPIATVSDFEPVSATIDNESLTCSTPLIRPAENTSDDLLREDTPIKESDKTASVTSDMSLESMIPVNPDLSTSDTSKKDEQTSVIMPTAESSKHETSTDNVEPMPLPLSLSESIVTTSQAALSSSTNLDESKGPVGSSSVYDELLITHSSVGTNTDESVTPTVQTKSVASQMSLAELLDEIDLNQVMESAVRRCSAEAILLQYKVKMAHLKEGELLRETIRLLGLDKQSVNDASLKAACRACGVNKVLLRLPDIFSYDKQFFDKVLKVYSKKLNTGDILCNLNFSQLKNAICHECTSSQIVEMLSEKLKQEGPAGVKQPLPEVTSISALLKKLPMDVLIGTTVANEELIPASVVLDIALQNNSSGDIAQALKQSPVMYRRVLDKLWSSQFTVAHIEHDDVSKESLLNIFKSVSSKLTAQELLNAYHEAMTNKLTNMNNVKDVGDEKK